MRAPVADQNDKNQGDNRESMLATNHMQSHTPIDIANVKDAERRCKPSGSLCTKYP